MKNIRIFLSVSVLGGEVFNIFEKTCFRNVLVPREACGISRISSHIFFSRPVVFTTVRSKVVLFCFCWPCGCSRRDLFFMFSPVSCLILF